MNRRLFASQLILPLFVAGLAPGDDHRVTPSVDTIVQRMAEARDDNQAILRAYTVVRDYRLVGQDRQDSKAQILAQISFVPPSAKKFVIQKSSGTGFGERAVRQMLEHETDIVKNHDSTEMSLANYEFRRTMWRETLLCLVDHSAP